MKITRIEIENFRNIEHIDMNIPDALALFGRVGQGKTSILEAVRMALLGECELSQELGKRGVGLKSLVRDGAKEARLEVRMIHDEFGFTVCLTISDKGKKDWFLYGDGGELDPADPKTPAELWEQFGQTSLDYARVAMQPGRFLNSTDLGDILAEFLSGDVDTAALHELAGDHAEWLEMFATQKQEPLKSLASFEALGDAAYARRTDLNRDIKQTTIDIEGFGHIVAPKNPVTGDAFAVQDIPALTDSVAIVEVKIANALVEKGRAAESKTPEEINALRMEYTAERDRLCEVDQDLGVELRAGQEKSEQTLSEVEVSNTARTELTRGYEMLTLEVDRIKAELETLGTDAGACPTCKRRYTEKYKKESIGPIEATLAYTVKEYDAAFILLHNLDEEAPCLTEAHRVATDALFATREKMTANQRDIAAIIKLRDNLPAPGTVRALADVETEIEELNQKLDRGREYLERLDKMKRKAEAEYFLNESNIELDHLEWAIDAFKNGSAVKGLISNALAEFTSRCNAELLDIGYEMEIEATGKKVAILLRCPESPEFRPIALCSSGQRALAQAAIAFAFSDTGVPVFLDNLNELDAEFRTRILKRANDGSTVIMAAAWQQHAEAMMPVAEALAPVSVAWIQDGALVTQYGPVPA